MAAVTLQGDTPGFHFSFWNLLFPRDPHRGTLPPILFFPGDGLKGNKLERDFHLTQSKRSVGVT